MQILLHVVGFISGAIASPLYGNWKINKFWNKVMAEAERKDKEKGENNMPKL